QMIDGSKVAEGDLVLGLASNGVHSNGYSLVLKILSNLKLTHSDKMPGTNETLGDLLLNPTKIYVAPVLQSIKQCPGSIHGMTHITGGGISGNLPRVIPDNLCVEIDWNSWKRPPVMQWLHKAGEISVDEMREVFNCGIGYCLVVGSKDAQKVMKSLKDSGEACTVIGEIVLRRSNQIIRFKGEGF
ncbi:MAG TPA: AIR synthase-related protein, partial [Bdellovibrionota bacterium]|nr:AIR synthase-related protein [Bdellovibrionota bacterium]